MDFRKFRAELCALSKVRFVLIPLFAFILFLSATWSQESRKLIKKVDPIYPELAGRMKMTGTVKVEITIKPDGSVRDVRTIGGNPVLAAAVEDAVRQWKYAPASAEMTKSLEFRF